MSYQLYRNTTLGNTLQESLDELIQVLCCEMIFVGHWKERRKKKTINIYKKREQNKRRKNSHNISNVHVLME